MCLGPLLFTGMLYPPPLQQLYLSHKPLSITKLDLQYLSIAEQ